MDWTAGRQHIAAVVGPCYLGDSSIWVYKNTAVVNETVGIVGFSPGLIRGSGDFCSVIV